MKPSLQLIELIKNDNISAVIPFLKTLSEEDKKELIPTLKKQRKYYLEYINLDDKNWGRRSTENQRKILNMLSFYCFDYQTLKKDQHFWWEKPIDKIMEFYQPSWLSTYINSFSNDDWLPHRFTYMWLMNWSERGAIQPSIEILRKSFGNIIFETTPKNRWRFCPENLEKYPITLKDHFWSTFQSENNMYSSDRWLYFDDGTRGRKGSWLDCILKLSEEKKTR